MKTFTFSVTSELNVPAPVVWRDVFDMRGVNDELFPWARMSYPENTDWTQPIPTRQVLFGSWIWLFGVIPVDQHFLRFEEITPGEGFHEYSYSILHHFWRHKRYLQIIGNKTLITDEVEFAPQAELIGGLLRLIYRAIFKHRHRRLRRRYAQFQQQPDSSTLA